MLGYPQTLPPPAPSQTPLAGTVSRQTREPMVERGVWKMGANPPPPPPSTQFSPHPAGCLRQVVHTLHLSTSREWHEALLSSMQSTTDDLLAYGAWCLAREPWVSENCTARPLTV